jgi:hypothetical protein
MSVDFQWTIWCKNIKSYLNLCLDQCVHLKSVCSIVVESVFEVHSICGVLCFLYYVEVLMCAF